MAYPTLASGFVANIPFLWNEEFLTSGVDADTGWRYVYSWRASALKKWTLHYTKLSDADVATLRTHHSAMFGRYDEFSFTDPETGTVHAKCRYDNDEFAPRNDGPNDNSVTNVIVSYV